jgi:oligopeptide transport system substrate-binding protein
MTFRKTAYSSVLLLCAFTVGCTNNPYPESDAQRKILYLSFVEAPRTLDPAVAYTTTDHMVIGAVNATLLEYHYLKRPYALVAGLAREVPAPQPLSGGRVAYQFELREGLKYQADPCFSLGKTSRPSREIVAADVAFEIMRIADPAVNSPVPEPFANIEGFREFSARLAELRQSKQGFAERPVHEQYREAGPMRGLEIGGNRRLRVVLSAPYPQILYWFAMPFSTPIPWEAVEYYHGKNGRDRFADHPVASGPYVLALYNRQMRIVLEANPLWPGSSGASSSSAVYPAQGEPGDERAGRLAPWTVGKRLPFIQRIEYWREKESIPAFNKFLQGYYDISGIIQESFDKVIRQGGLSPEMRQLGMRLEKSVMPDIYYIGFNMEDPVIGSAGGERSQKLRQAMSLMIDSAEYNRLFNNGRGVPAQSPLPPGIFGYDPTYRNPYRTVDLPRARRLLEEAGYAGGIDPKTARPLRLTFDSYDTSASGRLQYQFFVNAWRKLGIDVEIDATNYNKFQEKVRIGAYQIFMWGWIADYPDPENFFFLLWSEMRRSKNQGPNTANFSDADYDQLFGAMRTRDNDAVRLEIIGQMRDLLAQRRPWIELFHREAYSLYHGWVKNVKPIGLSVPTAKYQDIDAARRAALRQAWNRPVLWPALLVLGLFLGLLVMAVRIYLRERQ